MNAAVSTVSTDPFDDMLALLDKAQAILRRIEAHLEAHEAAQDHHMVEGEAGTSGDAACPTTVSPPCRLN